MANVDTNTLSWERTNLILLKKEQFDYTKRFSETDTLQIWV